jgi:ATP-dependent 26S proteasome regulatory subunit
MHQANTDAPMKTEPHSRRTQPMTGAEFLATFDEAGLIGIWADRADIIDSTEFARELRQQTEERDQHS